MCKHSAAAILLTLMRSCCSTVPLPPLRTKALFRPRLIIPQALLTWSAIRGTSPVEFRPSKRTWETSGKPGVVVAASCALGVGGNYGIPNCPSDNYAIGVYLSNGDGTFNQASTGLSFYPSSCRRSRFHEDLYFKEFGFPGKTDDPLFSYLSR